jgi:hypothetical protein
MQEIIKEIDRIATDSINRNQEILEELEKNKGEKTKDDNQNSY